MQQSHDPATSTERITIKQRTAVQREVARLLDDLAPERPPQRRDLPLPAVKRHRWPGRCILQGESNAVSVSWIPSRSSDESIGEMLIIAWRGVVSLPGSADRSHNAPVARSTVLLHPVEEETGSWGWVREDGTPMLATEALATYCRDLLEE